MESQLLLLLDGLLYPSESDEPVQFLSCPRAKSGKITTAELAELFGLAEGEDVEEREPERFWSGVTTDWEWYGPEERARTARFVEIRHLLEQELKEIQYFETGAVEVGLYLLGQSGVNIVGIKTIAVRT